MAVIQVLCQAEPSISPTQMREGFKKSYAERTNDIPLIVWIPEGSKPEALRSEVKKGKEYDNLIFHLL